MCFVINLIIWCLTAIIYLNSLQISFIATTGGKTRILQFKFWKMTEEESQGIKKKRIKQLKYKKQKLCCCAIDSHPFPKISMVLLWILTKKDKKISNTLKSRERKLSNLCITLKDINNSVISAFFGFATYERWSLVAEIEVAWSGLASLAPLKVILLREIITRFKTPCPCLR